MNDFDYDCKVKKNIANSARHKKPSSRGPSGCKLPHEYLTKKEINALNGEVRTYNLNKPVWYDEFVSWPDDIQREYLLKLRDKYRVSTEILGKMFGVSKYTVQAVYKRLSIPPMNKGYNTNKKAWDIFINSESSLSAIEESRTDSITIIYPVDADTFEKWDNVVQKTYLQELIKRFRVGPTDIGRMLGRSHTYVCKLFKTLEIESLGRHMPKYKPAWEDFLRSERPVLDEKNIDQNSDSELVLTTAKSEDMLGVKTCHGVEFKPFERPKPILRTCKMSFDITDWEGMFDILRDFDISSGAYISIVIDKNDSRETQVL